MRADPTGVRVRRDRGQAAVTSVFFVCVLFVAVAMALSTMGARLVDRTRAQTAADAVALASLAGGRSFGVDVAARHGAVVVSWTQAGAGDGRVVRVVVRVGGATASALATDAP